MERNEHTIALDTVNPHVRKPAQGGNCDTLVPAPPSC